MPVFKRLVPNPFRCKPDSPELLALQSLADYHSERRWVPNLGGLSFGGALGPEPWWRIIRRSAGSRTLVVHHSEGRWVPKLGGASFGEALGPDPLTDYQDLANPHLVQEATST